MGKGLHNLSTQLKLSPQTRDMSDNDHAKVKSAVRSLLPMKSRHSEKSFTERAERGHLRENLHFVAKSHELPLS